MSTGWMSTWLGPEDLTDLFGYGFGLKPPSVACLWLSFQRLFLQRRPEAHIEGHQIGERLECLQMLHMTRP